MEERSLDDFLQEGNGETENAEEDEAASEPVTEETTSRQGGSTTDLEDVEPATTTAHIVPAGVDCPECGQTVTQLWVTDGGTRCRSCVDW